jgi:hypothetical protein
MSLPAALALGLSGGRVTVSNSLTGVKFSHRKRSGGFVPRGKPATNWCSDLPARRTDEENF